MRAVRPLLLLSVLLVPAATAAQTGYMIGPPTATVSVRAGAAQVALDGTIYDDMIDRLTLERGDFLGGSLAADISFRVSDHWDVGFSLGYTQSEAESEFRDWVYPDDSPIRQTTRLRRVPLTANLRLYPLARGEAISNYAYIPARISPYVSAGAGVQWYRLQQVGDFMDYRNNEIFRDDFIATGSSLTTHVAGGLEYWISERSGLSVEARYGFGSTDPDGGFREYDEMGLGGLQVTAGIAFRF